MYFAVQEVGIEIGNYRIPVDQNGNISGGLKVSSFRPYLGLGFGRAIPKKRIGFMFEMGVQFHNTPKVYTNNGDLSDLTSKPVISEFFAQRDGTWNSHVDLGLWASLWITLIMW